VRKDENGKPIKTVVCDRCPATSLAKNLAGETLIKGVHKVTVDKEGNTRANREHDEQHDRNTTVEAHLSSLIEG
jgi:formiminotetrahydrofolate cyclodeaminase